MTISTFWIPMILNKIQEYKSLIGYSDNNDYFYVFDIDDTLYKMPKDMREDEHTSWLRVYRDLVKNDPGAPAFKELLTKSRMWGGALHQYFDKSAKEAEDIRGFFSFEKYLHPDDKFNTTIMNIKHKKWCFTNGHRARAEKILQTLGLENVFDGVICRDDDDKGIVAKPYDNSYDFLEQVLAINDKSKIVFFDDSLDNVTVAKGRGWNGVHVKESDNLDVLLRKVCNNHE